MNSTTEANFTFPNKYRNIAVIFIIIGVITAVTTLFISPTRFWVSFLVNNFILISLGLFSVFFLAMQYVAKMSWSVPFKKVTEALSPALMVGSIFMLLSLIGMHSLYEWSHLELVKADPLLAHKAVYLNSGFFIGRMIFFISLWIVFCFLIKKCAKKLDESGDIKYFKRLVVISAIFLPIYCLSYSFASFDWIMSVEPHWFSTIFAIYIFSGFFTFGLSVITLILIGLRKLGYLEGVVTEHHFHDLGKFIFGMSTFWAYIWISQYLLIWYTNVPEETSYFVLRESNGWGFLLYFNVVVNWAIPFLVLLPKSSKKSFKVLGSICLLLVAGHWLDTFVMVAPKIFHHHHIKSFFVGPAELLMFLGYLGLIVFLVTFKMKKDSILVKNDPYLNEGIHLDQ